MVYIHIIYHSLDFPAVTEQGINDEVIEQLVVHNKKIQALTMAIQNRVASASRSRVMDRYFGPVYGPAINSAPSNELE